MKMRGEILFALLAGCGGRAAASTAPIVPFREIAVGTAASATEIPAPPPALEAMIDHDRICVLAGGRRYCDLLTGLGPVIAAANAKPGDDVATYDLTYDNTCLTTHAGLVRCSGWNQFGQLGGGIRDEKSTELVDVVGVTHARRVAVDADYHACALLDDGAVTCWGRNDLGQTGSDTEYGPDARWLNTATVVRHIRAQQVEVGRGFTCARLFGGKVSCWGQHQRPYVKTTLADVTDLGVATDGACAIANGGSVYCWDGTERLIAPLSGIVDPSVPIEAPGLIHARRIAVADDHVCAILDDQRLGCFGAGAPALVIDELPPVVGVVIGLRATCAWTEEQDMYCFEDHLNAAGVEEFSKPTLRRLR